MYHTSQCWFSPSEASAAKQTGLQKKYFRAWQVSKRTLGTDELAEEEGEESVKESTEEEASPQKAHSAEEEVEEPKWKIALKSVVLMAVGVGLVRSVCDVHVHCVCTRYCIPS